MSDGLLTRLLAALVAHREQPRGMDGHVFEPACVPRWDEMCAGADDMGRLADVPQRVAV